MFRQTAIRQFSSLSRRQFRLPENGAHNILNGATATVYRVRFQKPPIFSRKRIRNAFFYAVPLAGVLYALDNVEIEIEVEADQGKSAKAGKTEPEDDEEVDDAGLFIPFGWPEEQPRTFYKGSDPEWKEFIKFSKDPKKHKEVQLRLVSKIRSEIIQHPQSKRLLGIINPNKGKFWLEISFPEGPPREYEVTGLEIADEFIAWSTKTVTQEEYQKLRRTLFPDAALRSSLASVRYQFDMQANKIRHLLGLEQSFDQEALRMRAALQQDPNAKPGPKTKSSPNPETPTQTTADSSKTSEKRDTSSSPEPSSQKATTPSATGAEQTKVPLPKLPSLTPGSDTKPVTFLLFLQNMQKNAKAVSIDPPRGTIVVQGLIEVVGTKGRTTLDVAAAYDPKSDDYQVASWKLKSAAKKSQSPKGGS